MPLTKQVAATLCCRYCAVSDNSGMPQLAMKSPQYNHAVKSVSKSYKQYCENKPWWFLKA